MCLSSSISPSSDRSRRSRPRSSSSSSGETITSRLPSRMARSRVADGAWVERAAETIDPTEQTATPIQTDHPHGHDAPSSRSGPPATFLEGFELRERSGSSMSASPSAATASITACQPRLRSLATSATERPRRPTWRVAHRPARSVMAKRGAAIDRACSVKDPTRRAATGSTSGPCATPARSADRSTADRPTTRRCGL